MLLAAKGYNMIIINDMIITSLDVVMNSEYIANEVITYGLYSTQLDESQVAHLDIKEEVTVFILDVIKADREIYESKLEAVIECFQEKLDESHGNEEIRTMLIELYKLRDLPLQVDLPEC